jgi:hypothetical protein
VHRHVRFTGGLRLLGHPAAGRHPAGHVAAHELDEGVLQGGQQRSRPVAGRLEQAAGLGVDPLGFVGLPGAPGQEGPQPELEGGPPGVVDRRGQHPVDGPQRRYSHGAVDVGAVVDNPVGVEDHAVENGEPAFVVGGQDLGQAAEDDQCLPVGLAALGLPHRLAERLDTVGIARFR